MIFNINRFHLLLSGLFLVSLSGCPAAREEAAKPESLKPNVSPANPNTGADDFATVGPTAPEPAPGSSSVERIAENTPANTPSGTPPESPENQNTSPGASGILPANGQSGSDVAIWMPSVVMSQQHRDTCKVFVGDKFPLLSADSLAGEAVDTDALLRDAFDAGNQLAVIVFWRADHRYGREQYERLNEEIVEPFSSTGVKAIAIHVGGDANMVNEIPYQPGDSAVSLIDQDESALDTVATDKLPRTYLVDNKGTIQWMDIEYSRGTRRELRNAILYHRTRLAEGAE